MIYRNMVNFYMIPKSYVSLPEGNKGAIPTHLGDTTGVPQYKQRRNRHISPVLIFIMRDAHIYM